VNGLIECVMLSEPLAQQFSGKYLGVIARLEWIQGPLRRCRGGLRPAAPVPERFIDLRREAERRRGRSRCSGAVVPWSNVAMVGLGRK
jgi:hypothetical protein